MNYLKHKYGALLIAFLLGGLWVISMRFLLVDRDITHYHANFAVFVDGEREQFETFTFYEEVSSCSPEYENEPKSRVHMHDQENSVVHVHDTAVTWGHFFENLEYSISRDALQTDDGVFVDGQEDKQLRYILNGKLVRNAAGLRIESEDVLLVDYSDDDEQTLESRYASITPDAGSYNDKDDPASCQGSSNESFGNRLKRTLGIDA